jgi:nitroimidazol reductase NimA-like FMN-containing flavoprotein (pyridoxamine 5'-phosphate oxidase superfamily)
MQGTVQSLTREECLARLAGQHIGRVSVSKDAMPVIVPVIYTQTGGHVVFRAPLDHSFATLCDHAVIAFEADGLSAVEDGGWSVHVVGVASMLAGVGSEPQWSAQLSLERITGLALEACTGGQLDLTPTVARAS